MEDNASMGDFVLDDNSLEDIESFTNPDEGENLEDVVKDDEGNVTPSAEGNNGEEVDEDEDKNDGDDQNPNAYSSLAKVLHEGGVIPHLNLEDTKIESVDDLNEAIKAEVTSREFADLNDTQKYYLEALRTGVPEESIKETLNISNTIDTITDDDINESEDLRQDLIKQYYIANNVTEDIATKLAKTSAESAEDIEDAKKALGALKELTANAKAKQIEDARLAQENSAKAAQESLKDLKKSIQDIDEIIPGNPVNPKLKDDLFKLITEPVAEQDGTPVNAVFKYIGENRVEANIKLAYLYQATNGFKELDKLIKGKTRSSVVKELDGVLNNMKFNDNGQFDSNTLDDESSFGVGGELDF